MRPDLNRTISGVGDLDRQHRAAGVELDLAVGGYGLSFGNSKRITGIRINAVDRDVERVNGINLTFWTPGPSPEAQFNGLALGLIGTKGRDINGVALSTVLFFFI